MSVVKTSVPTRFFKIIIIIIFAVTDNKNSGEARRAPSTMSSKTHQRVDKEPASKPQSEATEPTQLLRQATREEIRPLK